MLDRRSGIPIYYQLKLHLREKILSGELAPGQQTPSEQQVAKDFGISKMTVRQALADLEDEGLLQRKPGVGTFVAQRKIHRNLVGGFVTFFESAIDGRTPTSRFLSGQRVGAEGKIQAELHLRRGEPVVKLERVLLLDGEAVALSTIYVVERKCPDLLQDVERWHSLIWLFERKYHLSPVKAEQGVDAVTADARVANLLEIDVGAPLLYTERTTYLEDGTPIELTETYLRSDKYTYHVTLHRRKTDLQGDSREQLTRREEEVLNLIVAGLSNKEISERLCVAVDTVKSHVHHIMKKLEVSDRTNAALLALRKELSY
ncbi:MAG: UTRA domain-containing protein [Chloroflexi bacterium]|nr:UTRA domain-containing protein [Chloroflexota bacterium]